MVHRHSNLKRVRSNVAATSMLETKFFGDNYKMLVTVLAILVTIIYYLFTLASIFKRCYQHRTSVVNIHKSSPTTSIGGHFDPFPPFGLLSISTVH